MISCLNFKQLHQLINVVKNKKFMRILFGHRSGLALLLLFIFPLANAVEVVTWDGSRGVGGRIFTGAGTQKCRYCHETGNQATFWVDPVPTLNSYATVTSATNATNSNARIQAETMPRVDNGTDYAPLSAALQSLMATWVSATGGVTPENATPHTETQGSSTIFGQDSRYNRRINGRVNMNGNNTSQISLEYRVSGIGLYVTAGSTQASSNTGGGGAEAASRSDFSRDLSGLSCGTTYQYRVRVSSPSTVSAADTFSTAACNQAPTFTGGASVVRAATEDLPFSYTPAISNLGGGTPAFSINPGSTLPTWLTLNSLTGQLSGTPLNGTLAESFTIRVTDNGGDNPGFNTQLVNITVTPVNDPPVLDALSNIGGTEGILTTRQITVVDLDDTNNGIELAWSLLNAPGNMSISTTGLISWTPAEGFVGPQTVTVIVSDGEFQDSDTFNALASAVNDDPIITSTAPPTAIEDSVWSYQLTFTDPDAGDSHSYLLSNQPTGMVVSGSGLVTWTPDDEHLPSASNITLRVTDSGSLFDEETFSIAITSVNDQPQITSTATPDVLEGDLYLYQVDVLDQDDTDWPNDLSFYLVNEPLGMSIDEDGLISWQTAEADPSPATITVGVRDGGENGTVPSERNFDIEVIAYNYQPNITSTASTSATEDIEYQYQLVIDDVDDANDGSGALSFNLINAPTGMTISNTGLISWTATEGVSTSGTVTASVNDAGEDGTVPDTENFTIAVTAVNDPPVITSSAPLDVIEMNTWTYQVEVSDPDDLDVSELNFNLSNAPVGMTVDDGGFISWYAPEAAGSSGNVTLTVSDGGEDAAAPAVQVFNINVIVFNTAPVITSQAPTTATEDVQYQYQATVDDVDDANDGINLAWSLTNAPAGMQVSATGLVTWTPGEGITTSGAVTLTVADGGEDAAAPFAEQFTINVAAVNDAPQITSTPPVNAAQGVLFTYQVAVTDPDDANNGSNLLFSLSGQPPGMLISNTGLVTWTPDDSSPLSSNITITVADGGEDGAQPATQNFTLNTVFDVDQDGVLNEDDNCPLISNADQANFDEDGLGDLCDFDDDNDGMSDVFENDNGFNPFDPADAGADADGDGLTNLEEFMQGTNPFGDDNPPRITLPLNNLWISTGYLTWVNIGQAVATDSLGGPLPVTPSRQSGGFRPGRHEIVWTATDSSNNTATATQVIRVLPLIGLAPQQITGEGRSITVDLALNGEPPENPATVNYRVSGPTDSSDHNATNGSVEFVDGQASIAIDVFQDDLVEGEERFLISLSNPINAALGGNFSQEIRIVEDNHAPTVSLQIMQGTDPGGFVNRVEGNVVVSALVNDPNPGDTFNYDWSLTSNALVAINGSGTASSATFEFDPAGVATSLYTIRVTVRDNGGLTATASTLLAVQSSTNVTDRDDNGIQDSVDAVETPFALQTTPGGAVLESDTHLKMSLGNTVRHVGLNGAALGVQDVENFGNDGFQAANAATPYSFTSGLHDFAISGFGDQGYAKVKIEQGAIIAENAEFRVYQFDGGWTTFVEDEFNFIESATKTDGICPPLGDFEYEAGLIAGNECVQITIEDGGPNDNDGEVNGKLSLLGGVGSLPGTDPGNGGGGAGGDGSDGEGSSGSGTMDYLLWGLFLVLIHLQRRRREQAR